MTVTDRKLKPGWTRVKFGDVVRLSKERCVDPLAEGIERYVGLEHINPDDLRIRRWGNVADGTTFTNRFLPGQVLFGKRRAYLRKVAVADFEGICSSDIYVFESRNSSVLSPELLPYICQTDSFFQYAVDTSAGSLSPRTNWSQLAEYAFVLPSMEEQLELIEVFGSWNSVRDSALDLGRRAEVLVPALRASLSGIYTSADGPRLGPPGFEGPWPEVELSKILKLDRMRVDVDAGADYQEIGVRSFGRGVFIKESVRGSDLGNKVVYWMEPDKLIVNIVFAWEGAVAVTGSEVVGLIASHRFPTYSAISRDTDLMYVREYLLTPVGISKLGKASPGGAGRNRTLGQAAFLSIRIPYPPVSVQRDIAHLSRTLKRSEAESLGYLDRVQAKFRSSVNSMMDPV